MLSKIENCFLSSINQRIFQDAKDRMPFAVKDQLAINSVAPYCSKLAAQKLINTTIKNKTKIKKNS